MLTSQEIIFHSGSKAGLHHKSVCLNEHMQNCWIYFMLYTDEENIHNIWASQTNIRENCGKCHRQLSITEWTYNIRS